MTDQFAEALYEGEWNPPPDYLAWGQVGIPADRTTPEGVASYLRFGGRISDRVLMQFVWQGQLYGPMGEQLKDTEPTPEQLAKRGRSSRPSEISEPDETETIDGLRPGDEGWLEAFCLKNGIEYQDDTKKD